MVGRKQVTVKNYFSNNGNYFVVSRDLLQSAVNFAADNIYVQL